MFNRRSLTGLTLLTALALWLAPAAVCLGQPFGLYLTPSDLLAGSGISLSVSGKKVTITSTGGAGATNAISTVYSNSVVIGEGMTAIKFIGGTNLTIASNSGIATITIPTNAVSAGGGTNYLFNTNQFELTSGTNVNFKTAALVTNLSAIAPSLSYSDGVGYNIVVEPMNNGVWSYNDVNNYWKFDATNWTMFLPLSADAGVTAASATVTNNITIPTPGSGGLYYNGTGQFHQWRLGTGSGSVLRNDWIQGGLNGAWEWWDRPYSNSNKLMALNVVAGNTNTSSLWVGVPMTIRETSATNSPATKAYVDAAVAGAGSGTTNYPHITATNGVNILTNGTLTLYGAGYGDGSNYRRLQIGSTGNDFFIGSQTAGTGVGDGDLFLQTQGTNRWQITPTGNLLAVTDGSYDIGGSGANRPATIYTSARVVVGTSLSVGGNVNISGSAAGRAYVYSTAAYGELMLGYQASPATNSAVILESAPGGLLNIKNQGDNIVAAAFSGNEGTNWLNGTTTVANLKITAINGSTPKSVTNTWYSVNADRTATVTNEQVFIQGVLTSWKQNGTEL